MGREGGREFCEGKVEGGSHTGALHAYCGYSEGDPQRAKPGQGASPKPSLSVHLPNLKEVRESE